MYVHLTHQPSYLPFSYAKIGIDTFEMSVNRISHADHAFAQKPHVFLVYELHDLLCFCIPLDRFVVIAFFAYTEKLQLLVQTQSVFGGD